ARPLVEPLVEAMACRSFLREGSGTASASASARRMTSFELEPVRSASFSISCLSSDGMRRRSTGLAPGKALRRPVGRYDTSNDKARSRTATACSATPRRAVSRIRACFSDKGALTRTPLRDGVLALKVLSLYHSQLLGTQPPVRVEGTGRVLRYVRICGEGA